MLRAQGVKDSMPTVNSTIFFIHLSEIPAHKKVTYSRLVVDIRPLKEEKYRVRITVGGNKLDFCGDASSVAASLATVKLLLNNVVSTSYADGHLSQTLEHSIHFHEHMDCPVINPENGASLEYRHLIQGPEKDI